MDQKVLQQHITPLVPYFLDSSAITTNTSYTLTPLQKAVRVTGDAGSLTTIVVPPAVEMPGQLIHIKTVATSAGGIKITDSAGNDRGGDNMTAADDFVLLYSDGIDWICVKETTT